MTLPPLRSTAASQRGSVSLHSPRLLPPQHQQQQQQCGAVPSSCEVLHLPMLAATSLRPAKWKAPPPAAPTPPTDNAESEKEAQDGVVATAHPLLDQLLSDAADPAAAAAENLVDDCERDFTPSDQTLHVPTLSVNAAIEELGGADKMELLLQRLNALPQLQAQEVAAPFSLDAVQACVQHTLHLPQDAVQVQYAEGYDTGKENDASVLQVQIPLRTSTKTKKGKTSPPRPCLLLRVHRQRGVLSLHVVNIVYQGQVRRVETHTSQHQPVQTVKAKRASKKVDRTHSVSAAAEQGDLQKTNVPPPSAKTPPSPPLPQSPKDNMLDYAQLCATLGGPFTAGANTHANDISTVKTATPQRVAKQRTAPANHSVEAKEPRPSRKRRKSVQQRSLAKSDTVEFDPLRPEETTPFDDEHRPLTFNAAIVYT